MYMREKLICPKCKTDLHVDDEDLPYKEDETIDIECYHCDKKITIRVFITIDHDVICSEDGHRWVLSRLHDKEWRGKKYASCLDCEETDYIDSELIKTEEEWEETK